MAVQRVLAVDRGRAGLGQVGCARPSRPASRSSPSRRARRASRRPGAGRGRRRSPRARASTPWRARRRRGGRVRRRRSSRSGSRAPARSATRRGTPPRGERARAGRRTPTERPAARSRPPAPSASARTGWKRTSSTRFPYRSSARARGRVLVGEQPVLTGLGGAGLGAQGDEGLQHLRGARAGARRRSGRGRRSRRCARPAVEPGWWLPGCRVPCGYRRRMSEGESQQHPVLTWLLRVRDLVWRLVVTTVGSCLRYRVTGLAAEAAFFAVLSIPPLVFALAGGIGFVSDQFSQAQVEDFRDGRHRRVVPGADRQTRSSAIIVPTIDDVLARTALRRHLRRLRAGAVVRLAGAERLRRHHHDHARPRWPPRDRPDPGAVVRPLRARRCSPGSWRSRWSWPARA